MPDLVHYLADDERAALADLVAGVESRTGVQIVPAVIGKADVYPDIPWQAFAVGASFGALALVAADFLHPAWVTASTVVAHATAILLAGAGCALAAAFAPAVARLFLRAARAELEVRRRAETLFLRHGLFATRGRTAVLILVSLFERRIEIVTDTGFAGRVAEAEWHGVIARMTPHLRDERPFDALRDALAAVDTLLAAKGFRGGGRTNELPDAAIEERGA